VSKEKKGSPGVDSQEAVSPSEKKERERQLAVLSRRQTKNSTQGAEKAGVLTERKQAAKRQCELPGRRTDEREASEKKDSTIPKLRARTESA